MQNWIKCCFPSKKEDWISNDNHFEYKDDTHKIPEKQTPISEPKITDDLIKTKASSQTGNIPLKQEPTPESKSNVKLSNQNLLDNLSQRVITQEDINKAPWLILEEDENSEWFREKQLKINAGGLIGGRNARDGVTIFGIKSGTDKPPLSLDYGLNYNKELKLPYIFVIYYNVQTSKYYIRAYIEKNNNKWWFIKWNNTYDLIIRQSEVVCIGDSLFQITTFDDQGNKLEIMSWNNSKDKKVFDPMKVKDVTIGRDKKCSMSYPKDKSFSKVHLSILYDDSKKEWKMIDGRLNKSSTNGSWIFATHSFEIKDQMIVEILNTRVKLSLVHGDK